MRQNKILNNEFIWIPKDKIPGMPPRKPELRKPLLWLKCMGQELYLVNLTNETLDFVKVTAGGFQTCDDDVLTVHNDKYLYQYKQVKPNQAVKVEEYDMIYDSDYMLNISITVNSMSLGHIELTSPLDKGGVKECVLLWDTKESGKNVHMKTIS